MAHKYMLKLNKFFVVTAMILMTSVFAMSQKLVPTVQTANLTTLDGETVSLQSLKGKIVVLAIGATWLPLSKQQAMISNKLAKKYANRNVVMYFVATDSMSVKSKNYASNEQLKAFATRNKLTVPILRDPDGAMSLKKFSLDQLPAFVVLNKQGNAAAEPFGGLTPEYEDDLAAQIAQTIDKEL